MIWRRCTIGWLLSFGLLGGTPLWGQSAYTETDEYALFYLGGSIAWWKVVLVLVAFLLWVRLADWMNLDAHQVQKRTRIPPHYWNPLVVGLFLLGLLVLLFVPLFMLGFPVFIVCCYAPFVSYVVLRNSRMPAHQSAFTWDHFMRRLRGEKPLVENADKNAFGPKLRLEANGKGAQAQSNEIRARQYSDYEVLKTLFYESIVSRSDTLVGRRTATGAQWRKRIDGVWHALPAMEAALGERTFVGIKYLAGLDPTNRQFPQSGEFTARMDSGPVRCDLKVVRDTSSETLEVRLMEPKKAVLQLADLGLFPEQVKTLTQLINEPGVIIVSAPPTEGLSTTWRAVLIATDRVTKDWVGILDSKETETKLENIEPYTYDSEIDPYPHDMLRSCLLKQPSAFVVPKLTDPRMVTAMVDQVHNEHRIVITRRSTRSAAAALLDLMKVAENRKRLTEGLTVVTHQRLARRLCDACKQPMQTTPEMIKRLGGDPANPPTIYKHFTIPDPPPVDKKGRPIEIPPCAKCTGVGYYGRLALFELLVVDDPVRQVLAKQPDEASVTNIGLTKRGATALHQGFLHVLAGTTSIAEIQRVFKDSK